MDQTDDKKTPEKLTLSGENAFGVLGAIAVGILIYCAFPNDEMYKEADSRGGTIYAFVKHACMQKHYCKDYASARKECATAGSVRECVAIKLEDKFGNLSSTDRISEFVCNSDGSLTTPEMLTPSKMQCLGNTLVGWKLSIENSEALVRDNLHH